MALQLQTVAGISVNSASERPAPATPHLRTHRHRLPHGRAPRAATLGCCPCCDDECHAFTHESGCAAQTSTRGQAWCCSILSSAAPHPVVAGARSLPQASGGIRQICSRSCMAHECCKCTCVHRCSAQAVGDLASAHASCPPRSGSRQAASEMPSACYTIKPSGAAIPSIAARPDGAPGAAGQAAASAAAACGPGRDRPAQRRLPRVSLVATYSLGIATTRGLGVRGGGQAGSRWAAQLRAQGGVAGSCC